MQKVNWKPVYGYEDLYEININGEIRNKKTLKVLSQCVDKRGYLRVSLFNKKNYGKCLHQLICLTFNGPPPGPVGQKKGMYQTNHKDGNKLNNHPSNLEWITVEENIEHAKQNKLFKGVQGSDHHNSKFTEEQVLEIRSRVNKGETPKTLASEFQCNKSTILRICKGDAWAHTKGPVTTERRTGFTYRITNPSGETFESFNLNLFCKEHALDKANMHSVAQGKYRQYLGWKVIKEKDGRVLTPPSAPVPNRYKFTLISPDRDVFETTNLKEFCRQHPELVYKTLTSRVDFEYREYKGWKIYKKAAN